MSESGSHEVFDGEVLDLVVPSALAGVRVDRALSMLTGLSRAEAIEVIKNGAVRLNEQIVAKSSALLGGGQHLEAALPPRASEHVDPDSSVVLDVVVDDADFVIVNKAAGQVVHPGAGQRRGTLVSGLLARYPEISDLANEGLCAPSRPGIVHRLDKGTSGLLVVAKTPEGFLELSRQLAQREMRRTYLAMVQGHVKEERGLVDAPLGRSPRSPTMMSVRADGRAARTSYDVVARVTSPHAATLLRVRLETGRTHQIRVHLASIGHPVLNDLRYGHSRDTRLDEERFFLHSTSLVFTHPGSGELVCADAALPADLRALVGPGVTL